MSNVPQTEVIGYVPQTPMVSEIFTITIAQRIRFGLPLALLAGALVAAPAYGSDPDPQSPAESTSPATETTAAAEESSRTRMQQPDGEHKSRFKRLLLLDPSIIFTEAIQPDAPPLTPQEKVGRTINSTFGWRSHLNRFAGVGIDQWREDPGEWGQGWDGFGRRLGASYGRMLLRNSIQLSGDLAFHIDSRYDRCNCDGFLPRTGHAFKRLFVARTDSGGQTVNVSHLAGAYAAPFIYYEWYPPRYNTASHKLESGTTYLGWRGVSNIVREFSPEILRLFGRR